MLSLSSSVPLSSFFSSYAFTANAAAVQKKKAAPWKYSVERDLENAKKLPPVSKIINENITNELLVATRSQARSAKVVDEILEKAKTRAFLKTDIALPQAEFVQGLSLEECATLLNVDEKNDEMMEKLFKTAFEIKDRLYGNRVVLFTPLYVANHCIGSCKYCGYRGANGHIHRSHLSKDEIIDEIKAIQRMGHKRTMMLTGESPDYPFEEFLEAIKIAASVKTDKSGEIRRINVEIPQLSISDFKRLKDTNAVGTYVLFQETYHRKTYEEMHEVRRNSKGEILGASKNDYEHRVLTMDRAMLGGVDDVGIGALFGLYDYRFEVMSLLQHAQHLDKTYGAGPHTISIPRIRPADGSDVSVKPPFEVNDAEFKKLVAILRLAVPYTGMILTTRETPDMRKLLLNLGCSQMSAGSKTDIGSYKKGESVHKDAAAGQFALCDERPAEFVIQDLMKMGFVPSWCTACYRCGRTGPKFMKIAKRGEIHNLCHPNAIFTLAEYLIDYASPETQEIGWNLIEKELEKIDNPIRKKLTIKKLKQIKEEGKRDLYF